MWTDINFSYNRFITEISLYDRFWRRMKPVGGRYDVFDEIYVRCDVCGELVFNQYVDVELVNSSFSFDFDFEIVDKKLYLDVWDEDLLCYCRFKDCSTVARLVE